MKYRVDIDGANRAKRSLADILDTSESPVLNKVGAFASLIELDVSAYTKPILVMKTEEPGSKQVLAFQHDRIESVCYDMINHLINDCICMGAQPLAVQDLIVCSSLEPTTIERIVSACADACREQNCTLTGGETTQQPDVIPNGTYILGSSIIGLVEKDHIIDGHAIQKGDSVIGIASNGLHTNGYTLVRDLLNKRPELAVEPVGHETFLEAVLEPHHCYYRSIQGLFSQQIISGLAHITGGGIRENLNRILPQHLDAVIKLDTYHIPQLFSIIKEESKLSDAEMLRTFNMGVGLVAVSSPKYEAEIINHLQNKGETAYHIGSIASGSGLVQCKGELNY